MSLRDFKGSSMVDLKVSACDDEEEDENELPKPGLLRRAFSSRKKKKNKSGLRSPLPSPGLLSPHRDLRPPSPNFGGHQTLRNCRSNPLDGNTPPPDRSVLIMIADSCFDSPTWCLAVRVYCYSFLLCSRNQHSLNSGLSGIVFSNGCVISNHVSALPAWFNLVFELNDTQVCHIWDYLAHAHLTFALSGASNRIHWNLMTIDPVLFI